MTDKWPTIALGQLLTDIQPGFSSGVHNSSGDGLPHLRPMNVSTDGQIDLSVIKSIAPSLGERPTRQLSRGDVLFNNTNSPELVGKTAYFDHDDHPAFSNHMTRLRVDETRLLPRFLALRLHQAWREGWFARHCNNHVSQASIGQEVLRRFELQLPPLELQKSICQLGDNVERRRAACEQHIYNSSKSVTLLRQSVLAGAYTEASRAAGTEGAAQLSNLLREPLKNGYSARPVSHQTPNRVLTLTATTSGWFDSSHFKYTDEEFADDSPFWLSPGDIVLQRGNTAEYVGVPAIYDGEPRSFIFPDLMIRVRVRADLDPRFIWYMLLAPQARNYLRDRATGSAGNMPKVNQTIIKGLPLPIPPLDLRNAITDRLDAAFEYVTLIERRIAAATNNVSDTSSSILAKVLRQEVMPDGNNATADGTERTGQSVLAKGFREGSSE